MSYELVFQNVCHQIAPRLFEETVKSFVSYFIPITCQTFVRKLCRFIMDLSNQVTPSGKLVLNISELKSDRCYLQQ